MSNTNNTHDNPVITFLITCYNESAFVVNALDDVVAALQSVGCSYEIIVIDDCSPDSSENVIREYISAHPNLPIILHENKKNMGLAHNYYEGAFRGRGEYFRWTGGDNSEPRESLIVLLRHIGAADIVIPVHINKSRTRLRRMLSKTFTMLVNVISGYKIRYYNGSSLMRRRDVMRWQSHSYGFGFQADMLTKMLDEGFSYMHVEYPTVERKGNDSIALTMRNILSVGHTLIEIFFRRMRRFLYGRRSTAPVEILPKHLQ